MKLVIVESPYSGATEHNLTYLRRCLRDCLMRGESPYASHGLYTQPGVLDDTIPGERALGMTAGFDWIPAADATVVYEDYGISAGMRAGIVRAHEHGLPVEHRTIGENP